MEDEMEKEKKELSKDRRAFLEMAGVIILGVGASAVLPRQGFSEDTTHARSKEITNQLLTNIQARIEKIEELRRSRIGPNSGRLPPVAPNGYPQTEILYDYRSVLEADTASMKGSPSLETFRAIVAHWADPLIKKPDEAVEVQRIKENKECQDQGQKAMAFINAISLEKIIGKVIITDNYQHGGGLNTYSDRKAELTINTTWCWDDLIGYFGHETAHSFDLHGGPDGENYALSFASPHEILPLLLDEELMWQEFYEVADYSIWSEGYNEASTKYVGDLVIEAGYTHRDFGISPDVQTEELGRAVMVAYIQDYTPFREKFPNIYDDVSMVTNWQARRFEDEWLASKQADLLKSGGQSIEDNLPKSFVSTMKTYLEHRNSTLLGYPFTFSEASERLVTAGFN